MMREWFSLDGVQCGELGIAMIGYRTQPVPDQEVASVQIPGMDGTYDLLSGAFGQRQFKIRCAQLSTDELNLADNLMRVKEWTSGRRKLVLWDRPGIAYDARLSRSSDVDNQSLWGEFELVFLCSPVGYGFEKDVAVGAPFWCAGNDPAPCVITVTLSGASNGIKILHARGSAVIDGVLQAGQTLVVDGVKRYVTLNGVGIMPRVSILSDWPSVVPGKNVITTDVPAVGNARFVERWI